jgi:hypothetical protein
VRLSAVCAKVKPSEVLKAKNSRVFAREGGSKDLFVVTPVRELSAFHVEMEVFNFEVEEDNSYVAEGIAVHNCKVPFDTCSICLDWKMYREAMATFQPGKHNSPGEAILAVHRTTQKQQKDDKGKLVWVGKGKIRGLSVTRADYCEHAKKQMNKILPDGRKVFVYNDYPKFFDISFVFIGADKTAKVMMKIAGSGIGGFWDIGGSAELAEKLGYSEEGEKVAYKLEGHTTHQGLPIAIENQKGSVRKGVSSEGVPWRTEMKHPYGYIVGTKGKDGEAVDAYVGPVKDAPVAFVVHQHKENGKGHDEDKVMLGFKDEAAARAGYLAHYDAKGKKMLGPISAVPMERLKALIDSKKKLEKISEVEDALKVAFLGKAAKSKSGEIIKDVVPSQFAGKAIPALAASEEDLPRDLLETMAKAPLEKALSTSGGLGMVLRPREFQRIVLINIGKRDLADDYEESGTIFPESDETVPMDLGPGHFLGALAKLLMPLFSKRSALAPAIEKRVVTGGGGASGKEKKGSSSHSTELLRKIGAAYNSYRGQLMNLAAHSQTLISESAYPFQSEFRKLSSADPEEIFSPLSVAYLQSAFLNEVGPRRESRQNKLATVAGVERGFPSRNT